MKIKTRKNSAKHFFSVKTSGDIYGENSTILSEELRTASESGYSRIVLDLSKTSGMDSCALGVIIYWYKNISGNNKRLIIVKPNETIRELLTTTNLSKLIMVVDSIDKIPVEF
ncbi:MAG TPA: hypothetical protein DCO75_04660 [Fibrobacteres bacterium]|jgi:anti-anti-sigma factor|nr:hypothetical protein [Fibrobacterota bacterium]